MEAPITRTCRSLVLALAGAAGLAPAAASAPAPDQEQLSTYVTARAADALGDPSRAAQLLAGLVRERPADQTLRRRAIIGAIAAGDMPLALELGKDVPAATTPLDFRLLLVAEELRKGRGQRALDILRTRAGLIDSSFVAPFVEAWLLAERGDARAPTSLEQVTRGSALAAYLNEHRALVYLKLKRPADALPFARLAVAAAGGRGDRLRLAFADGLRAAGDRQGALAMLDGKGPALAAGRARIAAGKPTGMAIDSPEEGFGELMIGLALALDKMEDRGLPIAFAQVARYANPANSAGSLILALMLKDDERIPEALQLLRSVGGGDPFAAQARDAEVRMLIDSGREEEALRRATQFAAETPDADGFARLGVVHVEMKRFAEAADAYGRALQRIDSASSDEAWALRLFRASALEEAGRWEEAKAELAQALKDQPDNPLLLNFLGYGKLERGEDMDAAEAMVRKASALRPEDASITDSLGWAEFKRGRLPEAIATLQRAAAADPAQAEIQEHLGDALFVAGRRFEARFAWRAALVTADADARKRIQAKIDAGLTAATAAP